MSVHNFVPLIIMGLSNQPPTDLLTSGEFQWRYSLYVHDTAFLSIGMLLVAYMVTLDFTSALGR